jgi:hypothetical protein
MTLDNPCRGGLQAATEPESKRTIEIIVSRHMRSNGKPHRSDFDCHIEGGAFLCTSRQPFLEAARALIAMGSHPDVVLVMRHAGSRVVALRATLGVAARLTVDEHNGTRFARWKPFPSENERRNEAACGRWPAHGHDDAGCPIRAVEPSPKSQNLASEVPNHFFHTIQ